ncbi:hypothetical protein vseg_010869 [Gypsophila vaccaria]
MKQVFLDKYFPASQSSLLKKQISNIEQCEGESFYEYWERFKRICASCPYHGYSEQDLILYFCNGLFPDDARMVNAASGGAIINKAIEEAHTLIKELSASSRNFRTKLRKLHMIRETSSSHDSKLEEQMASLTNLVKGLMQDKEGSKVHLCMVCD